MWIANVWGFALPIVVCPTQVKVSNHRLWVDRDDVLQVFDSFFEVVFFKSGDTKAQLGFHIGGLGVK